MAASIRAFIGLGLVVAAAGSAWAAAKPDGGMCECGIYPEVPAMCRALVGAERDACIKSNTKWFNACIACREQMCRASLSPAPVKLVGPSPSAPRFVGSWTGKTVCRKQGTWRLILNIVQKPDGSFVSKASTEGPGEFTELAFKEDHITLVYSSLFRDASYTGRLVSPDRIEGAVRINTEDCSWSLAK